MTPRKKLLLALRTAILLVMALIFFFSAQDGVKSSSTSRSATEFVLRLLTPGYDGLPASQRRGYRKTAERIVRKLAHFTEFAVLSSLLVRYFFVRRQNGRLLPALLTGWPCCTPAPMNCINPLWRAAAQPCWTWVLTLPARWSAR